MNASVIHSLDCSAEPLIDWFSAETVINTTYEADYFNNPFDMMEFKAAHMDAFDLVSNQTSLRGDESCSSILTTSWKLEIGPTMKSFSLTDDYENESLNRSKNNNERKNESVRPSTSPDYYTIDVEKIGLCNEEEKQEIRKQTQQRICTLIETVESKNKEYHVQKSLIFMAQRFTDSSLNSTESLFNKGFMCDGSAPNSFRKTLDSTGDINDNSTSYTSFVYSNLNSFDLESLRPEWIANSFSDTNESIEVQTEKSGPAVEPINNNDIDLKSNAQNDIETIESESNGCRQVLDSIQNKKTEKKNSFLANIPVHHIMTQNYKDAEIQNISFPAINSCSHLKPVASSTPTNTPNNTTKHLTPSSAECSITTCSLQQRAVVDSVKSPITPINTTKFIKHNPTNLHDKHNETTMPLNASYFFGSANKRSNPAIHLTDEGVRNKTEIIKSFQSNKSKSEGAIAKTPKSLSLKTNKLSSLPVPKRTTVLFKEKRNVKPQ